MADDHGFRLNLRRKGPPDLAGELGVDDLRLVDAESGRDREVTFSPALLERYKRRLDEHIDRLERACAARGMRHLLVRADEKPEAIILESLRRTGLLG